VLLKYLLTARLMANHGNSESCGIPGIRAIRSIHAINAINAINAIREL
jgi:hypothetical protein